MPEWLQIVVGIVSVTAGITCAFAVWLKPLLNLSRDVKDSKEKIKEMEAFQKNDFKARRKSEELQKAQAKALIALLDNCISGNDIETIKNVRQEIQESLLNFL